MASDAKDVVVGTNVGLALLALLVLVLATGKSSGQTVEITRSPYINCGNPPGSVSMGCPAPSAPLQITASPYINCATANPLVMGCQVPSALLTPYNDGTDLGRAMAICEQHRDWYSAKSVIEPILYQQEWDACRTIHDKWGRSEAAKRFREQLEQEKLDKAFVETIANSGD